MRAFWGLRCRLWAIGRTAKGRRRAVFPGKKLQPSRGPRLAEPSELPCKSCEGARKVKGARYFALQFAKNSETPTAGADDEWFDKPISINATIPLRFNRNHLKIWRNH